MSEGSTGSANEAADIPSTAVEAGDTEAYARVYAEQHPRLVAYAYTLTGNSWQAEDLVAEAHFRVWRRLSGGHRVDNAPAYLAATVRNLAASLGPVAAREIASEAPETPATDQDPAQRVAYVAVLGSVLKQLPERWQQALWLSEAEDQPLEAVGRRIGTRNRNATAVLLSRAREGLRQAFLRAHPGTPEDPACEIHWDRLPAYVRDAVTPRQARILLAHTDDCPDCRARLVLLTRSNDRLPALIGPALLVVLAGGGLKFAAATATAAGAGGIGTASIPAPRGLGIARRVLSQAGGNTTAVTAGVAGAAVLGTALAVAVLTTGSSQPAAAERAPLPQVSQPAAIPAVPETQATPAAPAAAPASHVRPLAAAQPTSEPAPEASPAPETPAAPEPPTAAPTPTPSDTGTSVPVPADPVVTPPSTSPPAPTPEPTTPTTEPPTTPPTDTGCAGWEIWARWTICVAWPFAPR